MINNNEGFIKIPKGILTWRLYKDIRVKVVLLHLLLMANYKDDSKLMRGQVNTSLRKIASETGLTLQNVRTAMTHLEEEQILTQETTHHHTIITIRNYERYQGCADATSPTKSHSNQHTITEKHPPIPPLKDNNKESYEEVVMSAKAYTTPSKEEVVSFIAQNYHNKIDPVKFFEYYQSRQWRTVRGNPISDWRRKVEDWVHNEYKYDTANHSSHSDNSNKRKANEYAIKSLMHK